MWQTDRVTDRHRPVALQGKIMLWLIADTEIMYCCVTSRHIITINTHRIDEHVDDIGPGDVLNPAVVEAHVVGPCHATDQQVAIRQHLQVAKVNVTIAIVLSAPCHWGSERIHSQSTVRRGGTDKTPCRLGMSVLCGILKRYADRIHTEYAA